MKVAWILPGCEEDQQNMVFARRSIGHLIELGVELRVFYVQNRLSPFALARSWREIRRSLAAFEPHCVHAQYGSVLGFFAWALGYPLIVTFRGSDVNGDPALPWWRRALTYFLSAWTAMRAKKVICVSKKLAQTLFMADAFILPSPMDLDLFRPISQSEARQYLQIDPCKKLIAFAGGDRPLKRRWLALEATQDAGYEFLDIRNVAPQDMPVWINAADALILTSEREGSPNIVREALACGVPVVSVDVGDVVNWIGLDSSSRITGETVQELAWALREIVSSKPMRERRVDFQKISLLAHAKKLSEIYSKA